jgi:hypothetical protein
LLLDFIGERLHIDLIGTVVQHRPDHDATVIWHLTSDDGALQIELTTLPFVSFGLPFKTKVV